MSRYFVDVYEENIDFEGDLTVSYKLLISKAYQVESTSSISLSDLEDSILMAKGDGMSVDYHSIGDNKLIRIFLITNDDINYSDLANKIIQWFNIKYIEIDINDEKPLVQEISLDDEDLILQIFDLDNITFLNELELELSKLGIKVSKVGHQRSRFEMGAGDLREHIILFLSGAVTSGITWDTIKILVQQLLNKHFDYYEVDQSKISNIQLSNLDLCRNNLSKVTGESSNNLIIKSINHQEDSVEIVFETRYKQYHTVFSNDHEIKSLETTSYSQTEI